MTPEFTVNPSRFDPYKTTRFLVHFGASTTPVAAVTRVSALRRSTIKLENEGWERDMTLAEPLES
jgi:hypothetical protein